MSSRYLKEVRGLQNHLGDLNDVANVRSVVGELLREKNKKDDDSAMRYAAGAMVGWYGAQVPHAVKQALKRYKKFKKVEAVLELNSRFRPSIFGLAIRIQRQQQNLRHIQIGGHGRRHVPAGGKRIGRAQHAQMRHRDGVAIFARDIFQERRDPRMQFAGGFAAAGPEGFALFGTGFDKGVLAIPRQDFAPASVLPTRPNSAPSAAHPAAARPAPAPAPSGARAASGWQ